MILSQNKQIHLKQKQKEKVNNPKGFLVILRETECIDESIQRGEKSQLKESRSCLNNKILI